MQATIPEVLIIVMVVLICISIGYGFGKSSSLAEEKPQESKDADFSRHMVDRIKSAVDTKEK